MNTNLRNALADLAESQTFTPDSSAWDRGRRARRRDRGLLVAAVLVLVASLGGLAAIESGTQRIAPADDVPSGGALPSRIVDLPVDSATPKETALGIGQGAAAYIAESGDPVLVTAADGLYHRLDLTGWQETGLALSPSGERLAWYDATPDEAKGGSTTIAVADLVTGELTRQTIPARLEGADMISQAPRALTWSPDSSYLSWVTDDGPRTSVWTTMPWLGATEGTTFFAEGMAAVGSDGTVMWRDSEGSAKVTSPDGKAFTTHGVTGDPVAFSPGGDWVSLMTGPGQASAAFDAKARKVVEHPFPDGYFTEPMATRPLGWTDRSMQALLILPADDGAAAVAITTPRLDDTSFWRGSVMGVDASAASTLTLAVDLFPERDGSSSQQFTHNFGEPMWAGQPDRTPARWWLGGFALVGAGVLLTALVRRRWLG